MVAFHVFVNGQRVCLAGIGEKGVMGIAVDWASNRGGDSNNPNLKLTVGGLNQETREFSHWNTPPIKLGDEVTIKIVEAATVDKESLRYAPDRDESNRE